MKRILIVILSFLFVATGNLHAQEYSDNSTYYYNNFESATSGTIASLGAAGVGNATRTSANVTIDASTSSPLAGSTSLASSSLPQISAIRWDFVGNGSTSVSMSANDFEWNFLYRNNSTSTPNDPDVMTVGNNSWRYWLLTNGAYTTNNMQGIYITHCANPTTSTSSLELRYRYDSGNIALHYSTLLSAAISNDNKTYIIKVQRLKDGRWTIYKDEYVAGMTTAKTQVATSTSTTGSTFNSYKYSYLEATQTGTSGRFQWDNFDMYTRYFELSTAGANTASNGITQAPFYEGETATLFGLKIISRGNYTINQLVLSMSVTNSAQYEAYFNSAGNIYRSDDALYSTSGDTPINSVAFTGTVIQDYTINDLITSSGNTDGTYSVPGYYFITGTVKSQLNYGGTPNGTFTLSGISVLTGNNNSSAFTYTNSVSSTTSTTVSFGNGYDWTGGSNTSWGTAANWTALSGGAHTVPTSSQIARIGVVSYSSSRQPKLSAGSTGSTTSVGSIIFGSIQDVNLSLNSRTLSISSGVTFNASSNVTLTGSGNFNITGGSSTLASSSTLTLASNAIINSSGSGTVTLKADATGAAAIAALSGTSSINGSNFAVERYIKGNSDATYRTYRFLSSPVTTSTQTLNGQSRDVYNLKYLTGTTSNYPVLTGASGGGFDKVGNPTIYLYREDRPSINTSFSGGVYIGVSNITAESLGYVDDGTTNKTTAGYLPVGNGFALFYRGSRAAVAGRTSFPNPTTPDNITLSATGTLNQGSIPVTLWYSSTASNNYQHTLGYTTATANSAVRGFNLVGNPYPSSIDWETFSWSSSSAGIYVPTTLFFGFPGATNYVSPTYYIFNPTTKSFDSYTVGNSSTGSATQYIPSGQGFFVRVSAGLFGGTTSLTFNEVAKAEGQQVTSFMGTPKTVEVQSLRLKLIKDEINTDDILLKFNSGAKQTYDPTKDAIDMGGIGAQVSLSSLDSLGTFMAFKNFPPIAEGLKIKLYVSTTASGLFKLTGSQFETLNARYNVFLKDNFKKDSLLISKYPTYAFNVDKANPATFGTERFEIVFHKKDLPPYALLELRGVKETGGAKITWKVDNEANYTYFELEKLNVDNTYTPIYNVQSDGSGSYTFLDKNVNIGNNTYRLKQTDIDNTTMFSKDVIVMYANTDDKNNSGLSISPNPASSEINVAVLNETSADAAYSITIYNASGNVVKRATSSQVTWKNNVADLLPGAYIINVVNSKTNALVGKSKFIKL